MFCKREGANVFEESVWVFECLVVVVGAKVVRSEFADLDEMKCQIGKRWVKERVEKQQSQKEIEIVRRNESYFTCFHFTRSHLPLPSRTSRRTRVCM